MLNINANGFHMTSHHKSSIHHTMCLMIFWDKPVESSSDMFEYPKTSLNANSTTRLRMFHLDTRIQGFGREKDRNCGKFIGSDLVIFCFKEFKKFALCKSVSQSEISQLFILSQSKADMSKLIFHNGNTFKM